MPSINTRATLRLLLESRGGVFTSTQLPISFPVRANPVAISARRPSPSASFRRGYASHHSAGVKDSVEAAQARARLHKAKAEAARQHAARTGGAAGSGFEGHERVGPFPLGVGPSGRSKGWKRWSELGLGGKLGRMTRQTGNLGVILVGGTLFVVLAFALTTELFATNSPSVLYSHAVDLIRASDALNAHLLPPLTFTHTPHPSAPIRGSPPIATRHIQHPRSGREHLILTFWVHGRGIGEEEPLGWARQGYHVAVGWARGLGELMGLVDARSENEQATQGQTMGLKADGANQPDQSGGASGSAGGWFGGMLAGLSLRGVQGERRDKGLPPPGSYTVGEVHGDYVKNASGQYQLLSLIIDVPGSNAPRPSRAVVFWSKEADTEGLLGRRVR